MEGELHDWELLHGSDPDSIESQPSDEKSRSLSQVDGVSFGMFHADHFSVENLIERSGKTTDPSENDLVVSGDSGPESRNPNKNSEVVLADSSSGRLDEYQSIDVVVKDELGFTDGSGGETESKTEIFGESELDEVKQSNFEVADAGNAASQVVVEEIGESQGRDEDLSNCLSDSGDLLAPDENILEIQAADEGTGEILAHDEDSSKCWSDSGGEMLVSEDANKVNELVSDSGVISTEENEGNEVRMVEREAGAVSSGDESKRHGIVWWKMPFVLLKYCAFKISPVWTVSMAAAVMGLAILGRRLYNVRKKAQRFQLKVTINDKKVSRVMSQAARLNEAFTEVRRVPVIRPALPSPGANPWPVLSLR